MLTRTFLAWDLEGSTSAWEHRADDARAAVAAWVDAARAVVPDAGGRLFKLVGDGGWAEFESAGAAIHGATRLLSEMSGATIGARVAIYAGEADPQPDGDWLGVPLNRCARLLSLGHPGQVLVSGSAATLLGDGTAELRELGWFELRDVPEPVQVYQLVADGLSHEFPPLRVRTGRAGLAVPLPRPLTSLVGRDDDLTALLAAVEEARLVSVLGAGGIGKSRLTIEVLTKLVGRVDGCHFADLATVEASGAVLDVVARAVGLSDVSGDPFEALVVRLAMGSHVLVLDNCEHVLDSARSVIEQVLRDCPTTTVVATTRIPVGIDGERRFTLEPLAPDVGARLLRRRAAELSVTLDRDDDVDDLCRLLDGMPLAIELAAPWLRLMSCRDLTARLEGNMRLLDASPATGRVRSLEGVVDWSLRLMEPSHAQALCRVCVFAGGATMDTLEAFLGDDTSEIVPALVESSMLYPVEGAAGRRLRVLEPIREICLERLRDGGDEHDARATHAGVMAQLSNRLADGLASPDETRHRGALEDELADLRSAVEWAVREQPERAIEIVAPFVDLVSFLPAGAVRLAIPILEHVDWEERPGGLRVAALGAMARTYLDADPAGIPSAARVATAAAHRERVGADVWLYLGVVQTVMGQPLESIRRFERAAELARGEDRDVLLGEARMLEAAWRFFTAIGDADDAVAESVAAARRVGGPSLLSLVEVVHGMHLLDDSPELAEPHFRRALAVGAPTGYGPGVAEFMLGIVHARRGERDEALGLGRAALRRFVGAGLQIEVGMALAGLTVILSELDEPDLAAGAAATVEEHYPPIAAMPGFGRWLARAARPDGYSAPTRVAAITDVLEHLDGLLATAAERAVSDPLTRAERRVADLVCQGLTNREAAAELVVSVRTVDTHVANILRKLGVRSRVELAVVWAADRQDR
jgi:predicted ATPase/DNA-binding CsgD family transcriptional regulator